MRRHRVLALLITGLLLAAVGVNAAFKAANDETREPPVVGEVGAVTTVPADQTIHAYLTGYSFFDNTPPASATISHPVLHSLAGGIGTFDDPVTVAVGHSLVDGLDVLDF